MKAIVALCLTACAAAAAQQNTSSMTKIGSVDPRFQSYNVEMVEVIGGRFWKPYASVDRERAAERAKGTASPPAAATVGLDPSLFEQRLPIDLSNVRLRKLAAALGPAYMRVSGTWANSTFFADGDAPAPAAPPLGFGGVLTRAEWKGVVDFAKAVDAQIVTSFAVSPGTRDKAGLWVPAEAGKFLAYNASIAGPIAAAEFINEPTLATISGLPPAYDGAAYGRDFLVFRAMFREALPHAVLLGPGSVGEGIDTVPGRLIPTKDMMAASGPNAVDAFSYHFYGGVSSRCAGLGPSRGTTQEAALSPAWLAKTETAESFYAALRDEYAPGKPIWLTETGQTACGGDRWASSFADTFRYVNQMGTLARRGVQVIMHNTLAASDYALIDETTLQPRPNFWAALLWHRTMGTAVLEAGAPQTPDLRVYANCMKDHAGGVTMLALNLDNAAPHAVTLDGTSMGYTLTRADEARTRVLLNGHDLALAANGDVPALSGMKHAAGKVMLPAESITFLEVPGAANPACR